MEIRATWVPVLNSPLVWTGWEAVCWTWSFFGGDESSAARKISSTMIAARIIWLVEVIFTVFFVLGAFFILVSLMVFNLKIFYVKSRLWAIKKQKMDTDDMKTGLLKIYEFLMIPLRILNVGVIKWRHSRKRNQIWRGRALKLTVEN